MAKLLTPAQVAEKLSVAPRTLEDWRARGTGPSLPFVRLGRTIRYREEDVDKVIDGNMHRVAA